VPKNVEKINDYLFIDTLSNRNRLVNWAKVLRNLILFGGQSAQGVKSYG